MRALLPVLAALLMPVAPDPYPGVADPHAFVRARYAEYRRGEITELPLHSVASARMRDLLDALGESGGARVGDLDWWADGDAWSVGEVTLSRAPGGEARRQAIVARFRNGARQVQLRFLFVRERNAWHLDDVVSIGPGRSWTLTGLLQERLRATRPAGWDANAMRGGGVADPLAFVAFNYALYRRGAFAPLSTGAYSRRLRELFDAFDEAWFDEAESPLGFDPWVDSRGWDLSAVALTDEKGGPGTRTITARFTNHGRPVIKRFLFVREGAGWMIDDIVHGGGGDAVWTLSALLRARP